MTELVPTSDAATVEVVQGEAVTGFSLYILGDPQGQRDVTITAGTTIREYLSKLEVDLARGAVTVNGVDVTNLDLPINEGDQVIFVHNVRGG